MAGPTPHLPPTQSLNSTAENHARHPWPDVILAIVAKGRLLPGAGGRIGEAGDAVPGYGSARPLPIWCVLEERSHPGSRDLAEEAFGRALALAGERGCQTVGVLIEPRKTSLMPVEEVTGIALQTFRALSAKHAFQSIHFLPPGQG